VISHKKAILFSLLSAFLLWLSFPGGGEFWPLLFVALVPLLFAVQAKTQKRAALYGVSCGLVHFILLLYWIVIVLGKYGGLPWFIAVPALLLLAFCMSVYLGCFALFARYLLLSCSPVVCLWLLPSLWVGLDWLRGILFTGFPWMDLGYALYRVPLLIQVADLFGHHGVTFILIFSNVFVVVLFGREKSFFPKAVVLLSALLLVGGVATYSTLRLKTFDTLAVKKEMPRIVVGVVQGNIDQSKKWSSFRQQATVNKYLAQTEKLFGSRKPDFVIWPETALPFFPHSNPLMAELRQFTAAHNSALLTGAPWYEIVDRKEKKVKYYNSAFFLKPDGQFGGKYFKSHLVPFGEYVPLKKFLPFLAPLVEAVGDFSPGKIESPLLWGQAKAGILICFESVFPELSRKWVLAGANILVNLTNDAWYGKSSAPYHSLAMAVFRAVEARRSLVRSANTGISAFIEPSGRIKEQSGLFEPWSMAKEVVLLENRTFWVRYGYLFAPICLIIGLCGTSLTWFRNTQR